MSKRAVHSASTEGSGRWYRPALTSLPPPTQRASAYAIEGRPRATVSPLSRYMRCICVTEYGLDGTRLDPVALLEDEDLQPSAGTLPSGDRPTRPRPDHDDVVGHDAATMS